MLFGSLSRCYHHRTPSTPQRGATRFLWGLLWDFLWGPAGLTLGLGRRVEGAVGPLMFCSLLLGSCRVDGCNEASLMVQEPASSTDCNLGRGGDLNSCANCNAGTKTGYKQYNGALQLYRRTLVIGMKRLQKNHSMVLHQCSPLAMNPPSILSDFTMHVRQKQASIQSGRKQKQMHNIT